MAAKLLELLEIDLDDVGEWQDEGPAQDIANDKNIDETEKLQLIKARKDQGIYRKNVSDIEKACWVTSTIEASFLIASHIKPWSKSENSERLDGHNGLMLAPHIDHLFDRGYISFEVDGGLVLSSQLPDALQVKWGVAQKAPRIPLSATQARYLNYHRGVLLKK